LLIYNERWGFNGQNNDAHHVVPVRINQWTYGVITVDITLESNPIKIYENGKLFWQGNTVDVTKKRPFFQVTSSFPVDTFGGK
jgi:hypothetical protein